jgi:phosphoglycerate dehydrogenase-like enzyme
LELNLNNSRVTIGVVVHIPLRSQIFSSVDIERLRSLGNVIFTESETPISVGDACGLLKNCNIGIGSWGTPYPSSELVVACPDLKLWVHAAGTVKHMFGPHLEGSDLIIASCKTAIAGDVAEMVLGEMIVGLRQVLTNGHANRAGIAAKPERIKVLSNSIVGIVGASEVGKRVADRLRPTGCKIFVYDPFLTETRARELGVELRTDLTVLCAECDVVSLHTPDIPACRHIMGREQFAAMKDDAVFINTARGGCVDEAALVGELENGRLFAFLDVSSPEPALMDSPLRRLPNVVYTSHIAGPPSFNIGRQAVDDVAAFIRGDSPLCVVTADQLETTA